MKICFPVHAPGGNIDSPIYEHFGSAPFFVVADTVTATLCDVNNHDQQHAHGACSPLRALGGEEVDAVVVGGIGHGALMGLSQSGIKVFQSSGGTISENLALLADNRLPLVVPEKVCGGHGSGHSCGCAH